MENSTKTFNPKTSRIIKIDSKSFKDLIKQGYAYTNNALVPPNTENFAFSRIRNHWISTTSALYRKSQKDYETENQILIPKNDNTVMGPNKRRITIGSRIYEKLLTMGYIYNPELRSLMYPIKIDEHPPNGQEWPPELSAKIRVGNYSHMVVTSSIGPTTLPIETFTKMNYRWYRHFSYNGDLGITKIELYGQQTIPVAFGPVFDGEENCVLTCISEHFKLHNYPVSELDGLKEMYNDGVLESDLEYISKKTKLCIMVYVNRQEHCYGKSRNKRALIKLYYHNNHVRYSQVEVKDKVVKWIENLTVDKLAVPLNSITNIINGIDITYAISTVDTVYKLKYDEGIDLEKEDCMSATSYYMKKFIAANPLLQNIPNNHDNIAAIDTITQNGIMFCINPSAGKCIDLKKAYTNFATFSSYTGFPSDLSSAVVTSGMSKSEILTIVNDYEGFALIECLSIFDESYTTIGKREKKIQRVYKPAIKGDDMFSDSESGSEDDEYEDVSYIKVDMSNKKIKRWVSFPYLRHRLKLADVEINELMIGLNRVHLNLDTFTDAPKRALHKVFGRFVRTMQNNSFTTTDPIVGMNFNGSVVYQDSYDKLFSCNSYSKKVGRAYYPHITSYVQQYTEIEIEKKYLELRASNIPVYRIWIDGIVIPNNTEISVSDQWHIKNDETVMPKSFMNYKNGVETVKNAESFISIISNIGKIPLKYCITGEAGCGKSYTLIKLYKQMNNTIILVPKKELKRNYPGMLTETIHMFTERHMSTYHTILVDEYSMIGEKLFNKIPYYNQRLIIIAGDTAQLKSIQDVNIDTSTFNCLELTKNYRQHDLEFLANLRKTRETGDISWIPRIDKKDLFTEDSIIICALNKDVDRLNLLGLAANPNDLTAGLKLDTPVRFGKSEKNYVAGDTGLITDISPNEDVIIKLDYNADKVIIEAKIVLAKENKVVKMAYSQTIHGVQGLTIKKKRIILNTQHMWDHAMAYVAVSRATEPWQVYRLD